jgi:alkaline phosphatase D
MNDFKRRQFLQIAGTFMLSAGLPVRAAQQATVSPALSFPQGIASGDPQTDSVILWARAIVPGQDTVALTVQLSETENFAEVVVEAQLTAGADSDFTVRAYIDELQAGRHYYYRFLGADGGQSIVGRTMTAPAVDDIRPVNLAFASCQNYEQGYFGAWSRMITEDRGKPEQEQIQFVLHLGDFIYERYGYEDNDGQRYVRKLPEYPDSDSDGELYWADTLADYRHLYHTYLADPHLQAARARWPFVCTWDDHEFSNNSVQDFSTYGDKPVRQPKRKTAAHQAWFEYIPALVEDNPADLRIYRSLRWGQHIDLLLTDLRSYRSHHPLPKGLVKELKLPTTPSELVEIFDAGKNYNNGMPPATLPFGDGTTPNSARDRESGTMLGAEQKQWFKGQLTDSTATWKVWGNALPIMSLRMDLAELPFGGLHNSVLGTDAWSGFPTEYKELLNFVADEGIANLVSLSGDHHSHGAGSLARDANAEKPEFLAVDFNVSGISSTPQFSGVLDTGQKDNPDFLQLVAHEANGEMQETWNMTLTQGALATLAYGRTGMQTLANWLAPNKANPGTVYVDSNSNGYGLARFDGAECIAQLITVDAPVKESDASGSAIKHSANFRVASWSKGEEPDLSGPVFEDSAPFPFNNI